MKNKLILWLILMAFTVPALSQNALTDSLIAYYPFTGNANDSSGNGNNGIAYGAQLTTDRFGNANSAYAFNSSNNTYISYQSASKFKPTTFPISITAWVKSNTTSIGWVFTNDYTDGYVSGALIQIDDVDGPRIVSTSFGNSQPVAPSSRQTKQGTTGINDNQWHFIAAVIRSASDMDIYIDCKYDQGSYSGSGSIMAYFGSNGQSGPHYTGLIDDIRFYHRSLTAQDLANIYVYPKPYPDLSVELPADINVCNSNDPLTISPVVIGYPKAYLWSNGATTSSIQPTQSGIYSLEVSDGCHFAYDTTDVTFGACTGVEQVNANSEFNMYYSLDNNSVQIHNLTSDLTNFTVDIYNTLGQKMLPTVSVRLIGANQSFYSYPLPKDLASGVYYVNVTTGGLKKSLPIVK